MISSRRASELEEVGGRVSRTIKDLPPPLRAQKRRQVAERSGRVPRVRVAREFRQSGVMREDHAEFDLRQVHVCYVPETREPH